MKDDERLTRIFTWNVRVHRMTLEVFKDSKNVQRGSFRIYDEFKYFKKPMSVII